MLKVEIANINNVNVQQTNQKQITFLGKTNNKLEQTPNNDTFENKNKDNKKKIVTLSLIGATAVAALIEGIACKGKHIKKLFHKTENEIKNVGKKAEEKASETTKEESKKIRKLHKEEKIWESGLKDVEFKDLHGNVKFKIEYGINGKKTAITQYKNNGTEIRTTFDAQGNKLLMEKLPKDGSSTITYFYGNSGNKSLIDHLQKDGSLIRTSFDNRQSKLYVKKIAIDGSQKTIWYKDDGKRKRQVDEIMTDGSKTISWFKKDGKTLDRIEKFAPNGKRTNVIHPQNIDKIIEELPKPILYLEDDFSKVKEYMTKYCHNDEDYRHLLESNLKDLQRALKNKDKKDIENILNSIKNNCIKDVEAMIEIQQIKTGEKILALGNEYRFII